MPLRAPSLESTGCPDSGEPATRWRPIWPGSNHHLGSTWSEESTNFAVWAPEATAAYLCLVDEDGTETRHRLTERVARHLARRGARRSSRASATATGSPARGRPSRGCGSTRRSCCSTRTPGPSAASSCRTRRSSATRVDAPETRDVLDSAGKVPLSVVVDDRFDWGDDRPAAAPLARHRHLRAARQGHDPAARPGARGAARDVRRPRDARRSSTTCATSA